jgi:hypothetical protein
MSQTQTNHADTIAQAEQLRGHNKIWSLEVLDVRLELQGRGPGGKLLEVLINQVGDGAIILKSKPRISRTFSELLL